EETSVEVSFDEEAPVKQPSDQRFAGLFIEETPVEVFFDEETPVKPTSVQEFAEEPAYGPTSVSGQHSATHRRPPSPLPRAGAEWARGDGTGVPGTGGTRPGLSAGGRGEGGWASRWTAGTGESWDQRAARGTRCPGDAARGERVRRIANG